LHNGTFPTDAVNIGRLNQPVAVRADRLVAVIVCHDKDDVRLSLRWRLPRLCKGNIQEGNAQQEYNGYTTRSHHSIFHVVVP
jgi:hypothetical protein